MEIHSKGIIFLVSITQRDKLVNLSPESYINEMKKYFVAVL